VDEKCVELGFSNVYIASAAANLGHRRKPWKFRKSPYHELSLHHPLTQR
jgi:hypothetical protein